MPRILDALRDFQFGVRCIYRAPLFSSIVVMSIALGVGVNVAIFSLLNLAMFEPLPFPDSDRLVIAWTVPDEAPAEQRTSSVSTYFALQDNAASFASIGAFNGGCGVRTLVRAEDGRPAERLSGQSFSPTLFSTLGVSPLMGRVFAPEEDRVGNVADVALLDFDLWQRRFGGDSSIVGQTVNLDDVSTTIIGVLPQGFELFEYDSEFVAPLCLNEAQAESRVGGLTVVGRLRDGVSIQQAQAEVSGIMRGLAEQFPQRHGGLSVRIEPLRNAVYGDYSALLLVLQAAVTLVLIIACANVAGLLLARTTARRSEIATRAALGAPPLRMARLFMLETLPMTLLAGLIGVILARLSLAYLPRLVTFDLYRLEQVTIDGAALAFAGLAVLLSTVVLSAVPAIQARKVGLAASLSQDSRSVTVGSGSRRVLGALVGAQLALAVILLVGAGLMLNSLLRGLGNDLGADAEGLLSFDFRLPREQTITRAGTYRGVGLWNVSEAPATAVEQVLDRLEQVPFVSSVAAASIPPLNGQVLRVPILTQGDGAPQAGEAGLSGEAETVAYRAITRAYFGTLGIPLRAGRDFDSTDDAGSPRVAIVNEAMAQRYFSAGDPIGQRIVFDLVPNEEPWEIVGVVGDVLDGPLRREAEPTVFVPHMQQAEQWPGPYWPLRAGMYFVVRTAGPPLNFSTAIAEAVAEVAPLVPIAELRTVDQNVATQMSDLRTYSRLLGLFGGMATLLAGMGVFSVVAFMVARSRRDIAIRMALGCAASGVIGVVFRSMAYVIVSGLVVGVAAALALTRVLQSMVFEVGTTDPATYLAVVILLALICAAACMVPALRAARTKPAVVLQYE